MIPYYNGYNEETTAGAASSSTMTPTQQQQQAPAQQPMQAPRPRNMGGGYDSAAFNRLYLLQEEIGRGAFSVVHRCTHRVTGQDFAVKIIDLRPLRLRENFDQARLMREVEIMRRLEHPNIIRLEEVFETSTTLMMVLEFAQGTELFDSILQKKRYTEEEARPIFEQVAHALGYMHSMHIVHRDIKPENVVLLNRPSPDGYYPFAKLLDFGLSKMTGADGGSAAQTFVGTPCYLAPEVEARAYGRGHAYGTKVDCWSLGAVLYVMLVARFPDFDRSGGGMHVKLEGPAWSQVSDAAKDLVRCLMNPDPNARHSIAQALQHPWVTGQPFPSSGAGLQIVQRPNNSNVLSFPLGPAAQGFQQPAPMQQGHPQQQQQQQQQPGPMAGATATPMYSSMSDGSAPPSPYISEPGTSGQQKYEVYKLTSTGEQVRTSMRMGPDLEVVRGSSANSEPSGTTTTGRELQAFPVEGVNLLPLVRIQQSIAHSIELAHRACEHHPEDADDIKRSAILCRSQLIYSTKLLRKIEQTATSVLELFPDLELAVEDNEPVLAHQFFQTVKKWVGDLRESIIEAQHRNHENMFKLHNILHHEHEEPRMAEDVTMEQEAEEMMPPPPPSRTPNMEVDSNPPRNPFSPPPPPQAGGTPQHVPSRRMTRVREREEETKELGGGGAGVAVPHGERLSSHDQGMLSLDNDLYHVVKKLKDAKANDEISEQQLLDLFFPLTAGPTARKSSRSSTPSQSGEGASRTGSLQSEGSSGGEAGGGEEGGFLHMQQSVEEDTTGHELELVLEKLRDVDGILEQLAVFWANTEVILEVLLQKSEHVERFVEFAHKPRLLTRFQQRMAEYRKFWESIQAMCRHYTHAVAYPPPANGTTSGPPRFYGFLETDT